MRTHYIFLASAILFLSVLPCTSREQTNTDDRLSLQKEFFPRIPEGTTARALPAIAFYAKKLGLKPLSKNHMRFFVQPMGIVSQAIDVNLVSGDFISYPGTHDKEQPKTNSINSKDLSELCNMLVSKEFLDIPSINRKMGMDGSSLVIEVDFNDSYKWISHWSADDKNLLESVNKINEIVAASWINSYIKNSGEGPVKPNHVRVFGPEGMEFDYTITDIDLVTGKLAYHMQSTTINRTLNKEQINQLKKELISDEFHKTGELSIMSRRGSRQGGSASMIEYDIDGKYFRKTGDSGGFMNRDEPFNKVKQLIWDFIFK